MKYQTPESQQRRAQVDRYTLGQKDVEMLEGLEHLQVCYISARIKIKVRVPRRHQYPGYGHVSKSRHWLERPANMGLGSQYDSWTVTGSVADESTYEDSGGVDS